MQSSRPPLSCSLMLDILKMCWHPRLFLPKQPKFDFCSVQSNLLCGNGSHAATILCLEPKKVLNMSSLPLSALLEGVNAAGDGKRAHLLQDGLMNNVQRQWPFSSVWHHATLRQQSSEYIAQSACGIFCLKRVRTKRQISFRTGTSLPSLTETVNLNVI